MELKCQYQTYEWGKVGLESKVATLFKVANPSCEIDDNTPYAELWMGTHVNGPSKNKSTGEPLNFLIKRHPEYLGEPIRQRFGSELPFLFKVLSVNKALSIQAHPSKAHAEELHRERPDLYKDSNHKPELAIALTPFEALCGFRPISEIQAFMRNVRELRAVVGTDAAEKFIVSDKANAKEMLKLCFRNLMTCPQDQVTVQLKQILEKFSTLKEEERQPQLAFLVERLYSQFPDDVGCFAVYFFNYVTLEPHEALYLGANEPHAYLSGDCIECMACSDNVVRAGLTPKFKDVDTLCAMLNYDSKPAESQLFRPFVENSFTRIFRPPVPDFQVAKIEVPACSGMFCLTAWNSASILLVVAGSACCNGITLQPGVVLFVPANDKLGLENVKQDMLLFQAMANVGNLF